MGVRIPHGKGQLWGLSDPLKNIGSQCYGNLCSRKINNGDSGTAAGRLQYSRLVGVTFSPPREKSALCDAAFHQNCLTTCKLTILVKTGNMEQEFILTAGMA